jgi:hypothetical protein
MMSFSAESAGSDKWRTAAARAGRPRQKVRFAARGFAVVVRFLRCRNPGLGALVQDVEHAGELADSERAFEQGRVQLQDFAAVPGRHGEHQVHAAQDLGSQLAGGELLRVAAERADDVGRDGLDGISHHGPGPCAPHLETARQHLVEPRLEQPFGHRRAADVARADSQDSYWCG